MRIYTAFDQHYLEPAVAMIRSLGRSNPTTSLTILSIDLSLRQKHWLADQSEISLRFYDITIRTDVGIGLWFTPAVYARFQGAEILGDDRLLYIDPDTLIMDDLTPLAEIDLGASPIAGVPSIATPTIGSPLGIRDAENLGLDPTAPYISAGVLLMDRRHWLSGPYRDRLWSYAQSRPKISMADQECLNYALAGDWHRIHLRWNMETGLREPMGLHRYMMARYYDRTEITEALSDPAIIHYNGPQKPWRSESSDPWTRLWWSIRLDHDPSHDRPDADPL